MNSEKKKYYISLTFFWIVGGAFLIFYLVYFLLPLFTPSSEASVSEETSVRGNEIDTIVDGLYSIDKIVTTTDAVWLGILADQGSLMSKRTYDIWKKTDRELILWYEGGWSDLTDAQFEWNVDTDGQLSTFLSQGGLEGNARLTRTLKDPLGNVRLTSIQFADNHEIELSKGDGKFYTIGLEFSGDEYQPFPGGVGTCVNGDSKVMLDTFVVEVREQSSYESFLNRQEVVARQEIELLQNTVSCSTNVFPDAYVPNPIGLLEFDDTQTVRFGLPNGQLIILDVSSFPFEIIT